MERDELHRAARTVLMPAIGGLTLDDTVRRHLHAGGVSVLLGETRDEYQARSMSFERQRAETHVQFSAMAKEARLCAAAPVLIAVDQELGGIQRLHGLVPGMPTPATLTHMSAADIEARCYEMAGSARVMGINLFLAPIVDVVTGVNPWLHNRNLGPDPAEVARIACAFIRGVQRAGIIATAKHFPGHHALAQDPAVERAVVPDNAAALRDGLEVFRQVIAAGVAAIMPGPAVFPMLDPQRAASTSATVIALLRHELGFEGLVVSDDLDAVSILAGNSIAETAVAALKAGAHLLLVSAEAGLDDLAHAIEQAVAQGQLDARSLLAAALKVRSTAQASHAQVEAGLYVSYPVSGGHLTRRVTH